MSPNFVLSPSGIAGLTHSLRLLVRTHFSAQSTSPRGTDLSVIFRLTVVIVKLAFLSVP